MLPEIVHIWTAGQVLGVDEEQALITIRDSFRKTKAMAAAHSAVQCPVIRLLSPHVCGQQEDIGDARHTAIIQALQCNTAFTDRNLQVEWGTLFHLVYSIMFYPTNSNPFYIHICTIIHDSDVWITMQLSCNVSPADRVARLGVCNTERAFQWQKLARRISFKYGNDAISLLWLSFIRSSLQTAIDYFSLNTLIVFRLQNFLHDFNYSWKRWKDIFCYIFRWNMTQFVSIARFGVTA